MNRMQKIAGNIGAYFAGIHKGVFWVSTLFTALLVFINYAYGLNEWLNGREGAGQYLGWYGLFLLAFSFAYGLGTATGNSKVFREGRFVLLLLLAPAIFAWKMSFDFWLPFVTDEQENTYWNKVIYWPFKLAVILLALGAVWKVFDRQQPFYGFTYRDFSLKPYLLMLLIMVPLIAAASTQPDFLAMYPKFKNVAFLTEGRSSGWYKVLYELSYGIDFVGIELFFRGFLVLAFVKWAGKDAILPMAIFYCTIHFGKPLGECISSFFGGIILGVVTYHTRSILGGLIVHLGIAWLMELGGYLGRHLV